MDNELMEFLLEKIVDLEIKNRELKSRNKELENMNKSANEIIKNLKLEITNYRIIQLCQEEESQKD